jgi:hypothetical protein
MRHSIDSKRDTRIAAFRGICGIPAYSRISIGKDTDINKTKGRPENELKERPFSISAHLKELSLESP